MDAKATVLIGPFSRGGKARFEVAAADHDFHPEEKLTPFGIFLPDKDELSLYFTPSRVTSDFIVDCLEDFWRKNRARFPQVETLLINLDNGPENHSRRTQFMKRLIDLVDAFEMTIKLAYYPPYHSKYNPIERVWGILEQHWNGQLLDRIDTVLNWAQTMTWNGQHPIVQWVEKTYQTGQRLTHKAMAALERRWVRCPALPKWFVHMEPTPT